VVAEAMVALILAGLAQEKFGGDSVEEMKRNYQGYIEQIRSF
jgi:chorismate synthase